MSEIEVGDDVRTEWGIGRVTAIREGANGAIYEVTTDIMDLELFREEIERDA